MKNSLSRAIKFREHLLKDLQTNNCLLVSNQDFSYANEIAERLKDAFAFYIEQEGVAFLEEGVGKLSEEDFYQAICNMRMPFGSVWLELDAKTTDGQHEGRVGAMIDFINEGLRVFPAQLFKLPEEKTTTIIYSGSEVVFLRNGKVELADTPAAFHQDAISEMKKGRLRQGMRPRESIQQDTVREREAEALRRAIQCVSLLLAISGLHNRPEILDIPKPIQANKRVVRKFEQRGEKAPSFGLSVIRLGREGQHQAAIHREEGSTEGHSKRTAHWVRGHLFLARNGRLTWRKPHVRGEGTPQKKPRHVKP